MGYNTPLISTSKSFGFGSPFFKGNRDLSPPPASKTKKSKQYRYDYDAIFGNKQSYSRASEDKQRPASFLQKRKQHQLSPTSNNNRNRNIAVNS